MDSGSSDPSSEQLNKVYRLQGQLRTLERQQSTKMLTGDAQCLQALIQKEFQLLKEDQSHYERSVAALKKQIEERQPSLPPVQLSSSLMDNITNTAQLELSRVHSNCNHRYNQLTRKAEKEVKKAREELYAVVEEAKLELVSQNQSAQKSLAQVKHRIKHFDQGSTEGQDFEQELNSMIDRKMMVMEELFRTEVSLMADQNTHLTGLIEEAGEHLSTEISLEREQCKLMMRRHYERLEQCVQVLLERG